MNHRIATTTAPVTYLYAVIRYGQEYADGPQTITHYSDQTAAHAVFTARCETLAEFSDTRYSVEVWRYSRRSEEMLCQYTDGAVTHDMIADGSV